MIKFIKRIVIVLWILSLFLIGGWFASENQQEVTVVLFGYSLWELSIGTYLIAMLFIGLLLGFVTSFIFTQGAIFKKKRELKKAKKEVQKLRVEHIA